MPLKLRLSIHVQNRTVPINQYTVIQICNVKLQCHIIASTYCHLTIFGTIIADAQNIFYKKIDQNTSFCSQDAKFCVSD